MKAEAAGIILASMTMLTSCCALPWPAVPGVQRRQVRQEDPDWRGLRVAGQGGPAQARGQLAQAARQHGSDPLVEAPGTPKLLKPQHGPCLRCRKGRHIVPTLPRLTQLIVYRKKVVRTTNQVLLIVHSSPRPYIQRIGHTREPFSSLLFRVLLISTVHSLGGDTCSGDLFFYSDNMVEYLSFLLPSEGPGKEGQYIL